MAPGTPPGAPKVRIDVDGHAEPASRQAAERAGKKPGPIRRTAYSQPRLRVPFGRAKRDEGRVHTARRLGGWKTWIGGLAALAGVLALSLLLFGWYSWNQVPDAEGVDDLPAVTGPETILVAGTDSRQGLSEEQLEQMGSDAGSRADTLMAMVLPPGHAKATLLSIPRDLRVDIPGRGTGKINAALNDGPGTLAAAVQNATGLTVNHFVQIDFNGFQDLSTAVGGVPICIEHDMRDELSQLEPPLPAGCHNLEGQRALAYVRSRHAEFLIDGEWVPDTGSDLNRIKRQQQFMQAMLGKMASPTTVFRIPGIASAAKKTFTIDPGFSYWHLLHLSLRFIPSPSSRLQYATLPVQPERIGGIDFVTQTQPDADTLLNALRNGDDPPADLLNDPDVEDQQN